ncbi:MerR family transcriptional regulator [Pseudonocardia acaciae]|uniref:MerR family transcriptional regulator n=1 Tax=Pseudonocardia acaciae TaxID=551276 RepID=UPI0005688197|nr:MerR family transcriptional regulator [Pseudonocardia acaciae]
MDRDVLTIGQAAATFGLPVSTLRWWEREGLVQPLSGAGGRRAYGPHELRRIALIQLFRQTGMMSLDDVRNVFSGTTNTHDWRDTVTSRIAVIDRQRARLDSARRYLTHLLICENDDPTRCHLMDRDIAAHTSWPPGDRDETSRDETVDDDTCEVCGLPVVRPATGRPRRYCSHACRQRAYRRRDSS